MVSAKNLVKKSKGQWLDIFPFIKKNNELSHTQWDTG